jgi:hypothetical protein
MATFAETELFVMVKVCRTVTPHAVSSHRRVSLMSTRKWPSSRHSMRLLPRPLPWPRLRSRSVGLTERCNLTTLQSEGYSKIKEEVRKAKEEKLGRNVSELAAIEAAIAAFAAMRS